MEKALVRIRIAFERPDLRGVAIVVAGAALGFLVGVVQWEIALAAIVGLAILATLARLEIGFIAAGVLLLIQSPLEGIFADYTELDPFFRYSDDAILCVIALVAGLHARSRLWRSRGLAPAGMALLAALALGLLGARLHGAPARAIVLDAFSLSKAFVVLFAASQLRLSAATVLRFLRLATFVAAGLALFGFLDTLLPEAMHAYLPLAGPVAYRLGYRCLVSVFPNEGLSGWFFAAAACVPIAGYLVLRRPGDLAMAGFLCVASFFSYRRKPVIGIAFALGMVLLSQARLRYRGRVLLAAGLLVVIAMPLVVGPLRAIFAQTYEAYIAPPDPMQVARNALYIAGWRIGIDYFPIGAGLGLFGGHASTIEYSEFYARYGLDRVWGLTQSADRTANFVTDVFFPHVIGALGFVGAVLYIFALLYPAWKLTRLGRSAGLRSLEARVVVTAALLVFYEALAESLAAPVYEVSLTCFVVLGLAGCALSLDRDAGTPVVGDAPAPAVRGAPPAVDA